MYKLELSKLLMYEFNYDYIKNKYGKNWRLLFTDTGSLMYEIKTGNVCEDFSNDIEMFDFSNYSTNSNYYDNSKKLVVGKMKDETTGIAIENFFGLKPKIYSHLLNNNSEHNKSKSVNRYVVATISKKKMQRKNTEEKFFQWRVGTFSTGRRGVNTIFPLCPGNNRPFNNAKKKNGIFHVECVSNLFLTICLAT